MKKRGYKFRSGFAFKRIDAENFCYGFPHFVREEKNFTFIWNIKKYSYDDIFWKIMNMEENSNEPDSLRVCGAFAVRGVKILDIRMRLEDNLETYLNELIIQIETETKRFLEKNSVNEYVLSYEGPRYLDDTIRNKSTVL